MKEIHIDPDIQEFLASHAAGPGESASDTLRRELGMGGPAAAVEVDDDVYGYLVAHTRVIGESASSILRRELGVAAGGAPVGQVVEFRIPAGTGNAPWNTRDSAVVATVGDTLRIVNDDVVPHRPHTSGSPFPHADTDIAPGHAASFVLMSAFDPVANGPLSDHDFGPGALFWLEVRAPH